MKYARIRSVSWVGVLSAICGVFFRFGACAENSPPSISILYPRPGNAFDSEFVKIKAEASDPDGFISQVQFFSSSNLIAVVTNPPFNIVTQLGKGYVSLQAVAVDNQGATAESRIIGVYAGLLRACSPVVEIISPRNGAYFAAPATFVFSAEVLASCIDAGPVEFFIGTNSVGLVNGTRYLMATTPPASVTVSNLEAGEYKLNVQYRGQHGLYCPCSRIINTIHVVNLGVEYPRLTPAGQFQFEVLTSFPGVKTIVQASPDLAGWTPVSTNYPTGNSFLFTEAAPATDARRFYRVVLPDQ